jgi:hypothetical protein
VRLLTAEEAVEDFRVDLRDFCQADFVGFPGVFGTRRGRTTEIDFEL